MSPREFDRNFDLALREGKKGESHFQRMVGGKKIEVKKDYLAHQTGNLFIEVMCRGKKSGLSTTKARWWAFAICNEHRRVETWVVARTYWLKQQRRKWEAQWVFVRGGEKNKKGQRVSLGFFVPLWSVANPGMPPKSRSINAR